MGALLAFGGALPSGFAPTSGPAPLEGAVSTEGAGAPAAGAFAVGAFPVYFAQRHLVNIRDRHHLRGSRRSDSIESCTRDLYGCANQIVQACPLEFVGDVCHYVGQEIVPITTWMVLAENAVQR